MGGWINHPLDHVASRQNLKEMANVTNLVVPETPPAPAAYAGQFLQLDVLSVTAR
jgi:hypothetical protein